MTLIKVKHDKENPYVVVNKTIVTDDRLSWKAKGIWLYAFSRPDNWEFFVADLVKQSKDGIESVRSGLKELVECGYLIQDRIRLSNGRYEKGDWTFYEVSETLKKKVPRTGFPDVDMPDQAKTTLLSKEEKISKEDNNKPEEKPPVVVSSCLNELNLPEEFKETLSLNCEPEKLEKLVLRVKRWVGRESDHKACNTVLKQWDVWNDTLTQEEIDQLQEEENEKTAQLVTKRRERVMKVLEKNKKLPINVYDNRVEFKMGNRFANLSFICPEFDDYLNAQIKEYEKSL